MRYAVLLAGGSGTRLWPLSRKSQPKQFLPLLTDAHGQPQSLIQHTDERLDSLVLLQNRYVCTSERLHEAVRFALPHYGEGQFLHEPQRRNTAHAIGLAAALLQRENADAVMLVSPTDHLVRPTEQFCRYVNFGFQLVEAVPQRFLTFSIKPRHPATGYGYIEQGPALPALAKQHNESLQAFAVTSFMEKPDVQTAQRYLQTGSYSWNSGLFIFYATTYMHYLQQYLPKSYEGLQRIADAWESPNRASVLADEYARFGDLSFDSAILEPASQSGVVPVCTVPMEVEWQDIGSWTSYGELLSKDAAGNCLSGTIQTLMVASTNNLVVGAGDAHTIALLGCENLVVVHTQDATLIVPSDRAEEVKTLYAQLPERLS